MKNTVVTFQEAKDKGEKLSMLTAYDYSTVRSPEKMSTAETICLKLISSSSS